MTADILDLGLARQARGLPALHRVSPAMALPDPWRVGDKVRTAWGDIGTVCAVRLSDLAFYLEVQTARGRCMVAADACARLS